MTYIFIELNFLKLFKITAYTVSGLLLFMLFVGIVEGYLFGMLRRGVREVNTFDKCQISEETLIITFYNSRKFIIGARNGFGYASSSS